MAHAESITFEEFRTRFSTEESCRAELFRFRFANGFVCPKCGCTEYYPVRGRNTFQCRACGHQTSVTAGTVMHRTHLPLTAWFWAIYLFATDKRGISAVQLSRTLGICYESAWYLLHRIRRAMAQRDENYALSGIVEMDDGYVGGATHNGKRGRGTDKAKIVVALSKTENGAALFTRILLQKSRILYCTVQLKNTLPVYSLAACFHILDSRSHCWNSSSEMISRSHFFFSSRAFSLHA